MRNLLVFLILSVISGYCISSTDKVCWATYNYDGETNGPGGGGGPNKTTHPEFLYKLCKQHCYETIPEFQNIAGVKSCTIDGVPIEESIYKGLYLSYKDQICHVKVKGKKLFALYLAETIEQCEAWKDEFYWCRNGSECEYTLGVW